MPELPEVETVRRDLKKLTQGKTIRAVAVYYPKMIQNRTVDSFTKLLVGKQVTEIDRRGKYLLWRFSGDVTMVSHLRMEGRYLVQSSMAPSNAHVHVTFEFTDGTFLAYQDVRKFGRMQLVKTGEEAALPSLKKLGPEPFSAQFTAASLYVGLQHHQKALKSVLLDQQVVTGLGNIYVDEVLWRCQLHPLLAANQVNLAQCQRLHDQIVSVLQAAIDAHGTTVRTYTSASGHAGNFQTQLAVYQRQGLPCLRCQTPIVKIKVGGRGTHFCPQCQLDPTQERS